VLIKYDTGFIIALEVNEKFLGVESHSLVLVYRKKNTSPSHFLRNPAFSTTNPPYLHNRKTSQQGSNCKWRKKIFAIISLAKIGMVGLPLLASVSYPFPSLLFYVSVLIGVAFSEILVFNPS